jgi:NAD(P)-dependent dehydrogenase (short-subunit alcohol dehydrogenase family)
MSTVATSLRIQREPELLGQTVVVIGGSAGVGLETARRAHAEGGGVQSWGIVSCASSRRQRSRAARNLFSGDQKAIREE